LGELGSITGYEAVHMIRERLGAVECGVIFGIEV
jgi:hypothetical protein